ncbi:unnamed protein product [Closterium sp. NIES-54]
MIHAAAPHFLWPLAVRYAAHQLNLWPRVSLLETSPTLRWTGKVGDASVFRVRGSRAFVRDTSADKLSARAIPCVFLVPPDAHGWQFYHPTSCRVLPSQDVTFDESVPFYYLFPYRSAPLQLPPLFLAPGPPPVDPLPPQGPAPSGVSQVDPLPGTVPIEVAVDLGAAGGAASWGAASRGAEPAGAEPGGVESEGAELGGAEPERAELGGAEPERAELGGAEPGGTLSTGGPPAGGTGAPSPGGTGATRAEGAARVGAGGTGVGPAGDSGAAGPGGARIGGTRATGASGAARFGAGGTGAGAAGGTGARADGGTGAAGPRGASTGGTGAARAGGAAGVGVRDLGAEDTGAGSAGPGGAGAVGAGSRDTGRPRPYFALLIQQPVRAVRTGRRVPRPRPSPVLGMHHMALRPSSVPQRVPLPSPPASSLADGPDPESDLARAASPSLPRFVATVVTDPSFESVAASALVAELVDFVIACRLDYAASLVAESESDCPPSVVGECALGTDVLEDRLEDFECFAAAVPHLVSMLITLEGDPDAPDIPTPRSYAEAITGPYSSQWQIAMDTEMASWKSLGTYVDAVPLPRANIVDGMWIFRVKWPPGSPPAFKARYVARGFVEPPAASLRSPPGASRVARHTEDDTDTSLPPFYVLVYVDDLVFATADTKALALVKSELQKRHTCTDLGELRSYLGMQITRDRAWRTITLTQSHMVNQVLQRFGFRYSSPQSTPLPTGHSLSAPPSDESVEPSGPYPELVGYLMYVMTCTRPDLAYPLSILARYVAPGRHRPKHLEAAKRVLHYLCSTSGMGLVLGGRGQVVLTGHADASWVDDLATQRSSHGYTFSLGSGSVSWRSTCSSSVLSSSCEAEIYAGAMVATELRWLTYLLTDLGERPRSSPVLYVDNKAMIALCQEHILEHRTKHIALRYFPCSRVAAMITVLFVLFYITLHMNLPCGHLLVL